MVQKQSGFTLIELVVVVSILAILAATALPRYIGAQSEARSAKIQAVYGAVRSAAALAKAQAEMIGTSGSITMDGAQVTMLNRYPTADAAGILVAAQYDSVPLGRADDLAISGGGAVAGSTITLQANGAITPAQCQITYTSSATAAPTIAVLTGGC